MGEDDLLDPGVSESSNSGGQKAIPNATAILVLGIISIATCFLYGIPGLVCGIIALAMYKKVKETYLTNPDVYDASFKNAKAGMICAVIGTILSALMIVYVVVVIVLVTSHGRF